MIRTFSALLVLAAIAGPAAAQDIKVDLAGKDTRAISLEIDKAAWAVCTRAYLDMAIQRESLADCAKEASDDAEAQAKSYETSPLALAGPVTVLARLDGQTVSSQ